MLAEGVEGEAKQYAAVVQKESERLIRFLETFLDIARIEEGRQPITIEPVSLAEMAGEAIREVRVIAADKGIVVRLETGEGIGPALADRDLVKQCIINLVENAVKYSESGKDVVVRLAEEVDCIRMEIIDSGTGIREEELGRVFEKFYRAPSSKTKGVRGSGLGLAFVKQAVEAQGGTVSVESRYGHGSRFSVLLPKGRAGAGT
jgi:two-component system phosphate regulon sensor histidine kinase PhoR